MEKMALTIFDAVRLNNASKLLSFIEEDPSVLEERDGELLHETVLHLATKLGHEGIAETIIKLLPSLVSSINSNGDTPLHLAAVHGQTSLVIQMLECGEADCTTGNNRGETAFFLACCNNHGDAATLLLAQRSYITRAEVKAAISVMVDIRFANMVSEDGYTPLHFAVMNGWIEILKEFQDRALLSFLARTLLTNESVFHLAARHKNIDAFIFMTQNAFLLPLLYELDKEGNNVLHAATSADSISLVHYILRETTIDVTVKNNNGSIAVDLLNKSDENFPLLSSWLRVDVEPIQNPPQDRQNVKVAQDGRQQILEFEAKLVDVMERMHTQMVEDKREPRNKEQEMHSEALQNARNTITIVAVLIASVAFTCGINPPGGVHQEGEFIGKSTAAKTLAFKVFSVSNNVALFISLCIVILLVSVIPYKTKSLKKVLVIAHKLMWVAVVSMANAYAAAAWVTVPYIEGTMWLVYITLAIASITLGTMFVYLWFKLIKHILRKMALRRMMVSLYPNGDPQQISSAMTDLEAARPEGFYIY